MTNDERSLRKSAANLGPIGAASLLVLIGLGSDIFQLGISKVAGEVFAFAVTDVLKVVVALYVARCLCVAIGVHKLHDRKATVTALALVGVLFSVLLVGDVLRPFSSVNQAQGIDCFPSYRSTHEQLRIALFGPIAEELMFTGFLLAVSRRRLNDLLATAFVALVFSLMHLPGTFDLFLTRLVFMSASCVLFMKTSVLWPSILLHITGNASLLLLDRWQTLCQDMRSLHIPLFLNAPSLALAMLLFFAWLARERVRQPH